MATLHVFHPLDRTWIPSCFSKWATSACRASPRGCATSTRWIVPVVAGTAAHIKTQQSLLTCLGSTVWPPSRCECGSPSFLCALCTLGLFLVCLLLSAHAIPSLHIAKTDQALLLQAPRLRPDALGVWRPCWTDHLGLDNNSWLPSGLKENVQA